MTLFRVPLNILVMIVLLKVWPPHLAVLWLSEVQDGSHDVAVCAHQVEALSLGTVLIICAAAHGVSLMCFAIFHKQHNCKRASQYNRLQNADQIELKGSL